MEKKKISIQGKVAFVSGSNRGIGKAIAVELIENGAKRVYAGARNMSSLGELKSSSLWCASLWATLPEGC